MNIEHILNEIELFLQFRVVSRDGTWAPVSQDDLNKLHFIIGILIEAKWDSDEHETLPVEFKLINRHSQRRMHYMPLPVSKDDTNLLRMLEIAQLNNMTATREMDWIVRMIQAQKFKKDLEEQDTATIDKVL